MRLKLNETIHRHLDLIRKKFEPFLFHNATLNRFTFNIRSRCIFPYTDILDSWCTNFRSTFQHLKPQLSCRLPTRSVLTAFNQIMQIQFIQTSSKQSCRFMGLLRSREWRPLEAKRRENLPETRSPCGLVNELVHVFRGCVANYLLSANH